MTKHISAGLFALYVLMLPVWLYVATWEQLLVGYFCYWVMIDLVQSKTMHLWAAHRLWNPPRWLQYILSITSVVALIGTPISYAAWHRTHHKHSDTEEDPHPPAIKGWLHVIFAQYHSAKIKLAVDRLRDPFFRWLSKHELKFILIGNGLLFALLPFSWFLTVWAIPVGYMIFNTNFLVLVLSHRSGEPKNLPLYLWPLIFDDGVYHKDHHDKPQLSNRWFDPGAFIIKSFGWQK